MKKKNVVWYILVTMNLILLVLLGVQYARRQQLQHGIAEKVLRFHVLANSDSDEDQNLKLLVRDAVGGEMAEYLTGSADRADCERIVMKHLDDITATAERIVAEQGYDYEVRASLGEADFPVKTYGNYTFPSGTYEALRVEIGSGKGHNWWCVMYPNMCFSGSVYEVVDGEAGEALQEVLSEEEYAEVFSSGDYKVQFKYLKFLNRLTE